jgi:hypothetical protein
MGAFPAKIVRGTASPRRRRERHMQADFAVYDRDGQLVLTVEVKNRLKTTRKWAAEMRYDLLASGEYPIAPYFLLAVPDRFYLWRQTAHTVTARMPDFVADAEPLLRQYYEPSDYRIGQLSAGTFELIVGFWLGSLVYFGPRPDELPRHAEWLTSSGLLKAVQGGRIAAEMLA